MYARSDLERALICVPGVAFSLSGQRLGRGGGYYDRLLAAVHPQAITAGLAYSFQVLDRLPQSPQDRRLGLIVTASAFMWHRTRFRSANAQDGLKEVIPGVVKSDRCSWASWLVARPFTYGFWRDSRKETATSRTPPARPSESSRKPERKAN